MFFDPMALLLKCSLCILLTSFLTLVPVGAKGSGAGLHRQKREWIVAPRQLKENHDYTGLRSIARIRSDKENFTNIWYFLSGPGVDQPPEGVFRVERETGFVKIFAILDREKIPFYHLKGLAKYTNGSEAEKDIDIKIFVVDENDCPPVIKAQQVGSVSEGAEAGTVVMKVIATDDDQENTAHSQISYSIVEQSNTAGMFYINSETGEVKVRQERLDREVQDTYRLMIKASDMGGMAGGNTGSGEIEIKILDINDNIPTLEKDSYEGSIQENTINKEVMRIKAIDLDMIHTDNWLAEYKIISGNEGGYFSITTDSKTNEGIIWIHKALDYEEIKTLNLELMVANKAKYNFGSGHMTGASPPKSYPVKINVVNQKEGPRFQPNVKAVTISEDHTSISLNQILANYAAIDSDTLRTATNVRYAKIRDDDNWLIIDEKTADIRLNKLPDRESKFLVNGTYYAEIVCITNESPLKTATGTIAIQVEDSNDHCPELTTKTQTMCLEDNVVYITAEDKDEFPNSAPFDFTVIPGNSKEKWKVEPLNETSAILREESHLWPRTYEVKVVVTDQQGKSCADVQVMEVIACTCNEGTKTCKSRTAKTVGFGSSGILLLLLGLLLLLLLPLLLLFCLCGGASAIGDFKAIPFDTKQQLISYHTEGQGEDKEVPLLHVPVEVDAKNINGYDRQGYLVDEVTGRGIGAGGTSSWTTKDFLNQHEQDMVDGRMTGQEYNFSHYRAGAFDGMALSEHFLGEYYSSKSNHAAQQSTQKDGLLVYDYEGAESLAGSVGCCSLLENDGDLAFLNDLGPKFKTLAEICHGSTLVTETVDAGVSLTPPRPVSPIRPSTHTHFHTHTETVRDRDHVNINTLNTSNVASGSSTFIQQEQITERAQGSATVPKVHIQDKIVIPSPTMLIQQPTMCYAATPMYVVDSKPQMVLVAGGAQQATGQIGQVGLSQGLVQVGGVQGSHGVVLVDRQVGLGGVTGQIAQGLPQGTLSRQVLLVENGSTGGEQLAHFTQGSVQTAHGAVLVDGQVGLGGVTGQIVQGFPQGTLSRQVLLVENGSTGGEQLAHFTQGSVQTAHGSTEQGLEVRGQGMQVKTQSQSLASLGSPGLSKDFALTDTPMLQGSKKVVVQHKKVSMTERKI